MSIHRMLGALALIALTAVGCQRSQAGLTDADRTAIRTRVADFDKAMVAADVGAIVSAYTDDAVLFPPNAPMVRGRAAIQKFFEGTPKITRFEQSVVEIEGRGDLAYPWGTFETTMLPPGGKAPVQDKGKVLSVWQKQRDGSWLASRVSWNSDLPPAR
ncbi:MAG: SgcJ/EcaC family oxidoreductase [Gemmatimonadales bacterium]